ncbi:MAG: TrpB-like pyridoxal phosphate-dependent enzyme [Candidatus Thorarchaeota archaeon]
MKTEFTRVILNQEDLPKNYVNIVPHLRSPLPPPIDPRTSQPIDPEALKALFPVECIRQEVSTAREIRIPDELREAYLQIGRPTPLQRAVHLEAALKTPARIYFKREDTSPTGSHKLNTALAQAYFASKEGTERLATETGAGQWGSAVAYAAAHFGLKATIYMVSASYEQKPYRGIMMRMYGADVTPSPSDRTEVGRKIRATDPNHPGSLGIAISEALEDTMNSPNTKYTLGSVLNHVLLHQTVIGQEVVQQLRMIGETPDVIVGCVGGGSNFAGMSYPFLARSEYRDVDFLAVEPVVCGKMTRGEYRYDYGDSAGLTPMLKMHTLGADFTPPRIHAGGLRYHGVAPTISALILEGRIRPVAYEQVEVLEAGRLFARSEGIVPAPESSHAIKAVIDLALKAKQEKRERVIVFNLSGHGHFDMAAYGSLMDGTLGSAA